MQPKGKRKNMLNNRFFRKYPRILNPSCEFKIYSSISLIPVFSEVESISSGGCFVKTTHIPEIGETISIEILDRYLKPKGIMNAAVSYTMKCGSREKMGFGIRFHNPLSDDDLNRMLGV